MTQKLPILAVIATILLSGYVHGLWTHRWSTSGGDAEAIARLGKVPKDVGDWRGTDQEMDVKHLAGAGITGGLTRVYKNAQTGDQVTLMLVCGRANQLSVHTPDVCYPASGYEQRGEAVKVEVPAKPPTKPGAFWINTFRQPERPIRDELTVHFAWNALGAWEAPDVTLARLRFARYPVLYKLYVVRTVGRPDERPEAGPSVAFLETMLPELQKALFPTL